MMSNFLIIGFDLYRTSYRSLVLCKQMSDVTEYRITVMHGEIEKVLCHDNRLKESNGVVEIELSGNHVRDRIKLRVARALCRVLGKPLRQIRKTQTT